MDPTEAMKIFKQATGTKHMTMASALMDDTMMLLNAKQQGCLTQ